MSIESAILDWTTSATGLNVWQAPISTSTDKPQGEYATFQVLSVNMSDFNQVDAAVKDVDFITKTVKNNALMLISFNVFSYQGYLKLSELNAAGEFWEYRNILKSEGASINRLGSPQNLTGLGDTNFVDRWQMDIEFMLCIETQKDWDRIKQIQLTGKFLTLDGQDEVDSLIKWP